jgi:formylglycine-generating enzyme required for sulfatase activity
MGDKPVNFVSWFDAARVSNWLHNGATSAASMETGAYFLNNATSGNAVTPASGAKFFIPTENQWYKSAYYKGGSTNAGYWKYGTLSDTLPTSVTATSTGDGSQGNRGGNFANLSNAADWNGQNGNVTTVGTNGGPSAYGAFDMTGNVQEWNDLGGNTVSLSTRGTRGGRYNSSGEAFTASTSRNTPAPNTENAQTGFRLASLSSDPAVPEPSMMVIGTLFGLGGLVAKRRRKK